MADDEISCALARVRSGVEIAPADLELLCAEVERLRKPPRPSGVTVRRDDAFYFGCFEQAGHYWFDTFMRTPRQADGSYYPHPGAPSPWGYPDCTLQPHCVQVRDRWEVIGPQIEGHALVHRKDGWTALSFWDRSVDKRGNSNSTFMFRGDFDFDTMVALAQEHFPKVWKRFTFAIIPAPTQQPLPNIREQVSLGIAAWLSDADEALVAELGPSKILKAIRDMIRRLRDEGDAAELVVPALGQPALPPAEP